MDKKMIERIKKQLSIRSSNKLYCKHHLDNPCQECMKNISGNVSGISGNVNGIIGNIEEIKKILKG